MRPHYNMVVILLLDCYRGFYRNKENKWLEVDAKRKHNVTRNRSHLYVHGNCCFIGSSRLLQVNYGFQYKSPQAAQKKKKEPT